MQDDELENLRVAIAALEAQRAALGNAVLELALGPLQARMADLQGTHQLQHRQVTVMFADVVGSTTMASHLDAEDTLHILSGALRRMSDVIEAHDGRVLQFTGDGVKAAFGMEQAREDDAERAVRAGLAIVQAGREQREAARVHHGVDFAVRVGVHTGDVALGAGVEADRTAMGGAVNIAARMEQSAPPGMLRISHDTWNQVRGLFHAEPQPPLLVKGVVAPMKTYLVSAALDRGFAGVERGLQGLQTPMVGRDEELRRVLAVVADARTSRRMCAVTLVGEAGLGKSRLLREALAAFAADPAGCDVIAVRSQPDGMLRPWGLLRSVLATRFSVADTDSADVARRKVVDGLVPWFDERAERHAHLIGQLSGLDFADSAHVRLLEARGLRDAAFAALRGYLQALAARGPLPVLVVEDLHWADDGSLDLLQDLLTHAEELPLALVATGRPALLARRPDWQTSEAIVRLAPLGAVHSDGLARALLQRIVDVPARLSELLVGQAEGNPYYMEELVRRLIDDGVIVVEEPNWTVQAERLQSVRLPTTLVGLLQSRLDALPPGQRQAARHASVIGHVFWDDALQALDGKAPALLPALQQAAFVRPNATSDFEGTAQRQFDHHLLHQVTYDTLLKAERRLGHSAVARWLTERTRGRGAEFVAMTGEHAERAGETALAIDCFEQAGGEAQKRFAGAAASAWLRRAIVLLADSQPARRLDLLDRLDSLADDVGDRAAQHALHEEAVALLEQHPDDTRQARLWFRMSLLAQRTGDMVATERWAKLAIERAERCRAALWAALSRGSLAFLLFARAEHADAQAQLTLALQWAAQLDGAEKRSETEAKLLTISAMIDEELGRMDAARDTLLEVLSRGEALGAARLQLNALHNLGNLASEMGRWHDVRAWGQRIYTLAHAVGYATHTALAEYHMGRASEHLADETSALNGYQRALAGARASGHRMLEASVLDSLGRLHLSRGEFSAALPSFEQAGAMFVQVEEPLNECRAAAAQALCENGLGRAAVALTIVDALLQRLDGELIGHRPRASMEARWNCHRFLQTVGDARAKALLERLFADVQTCASQWTDAADRQRLIRALPLFRDIVAAHEHGTEPKLDH